MRVRRYDLSHVAKYASIEDDIPDEVREKFVADPREGEHCARCVDYETKVVSEDERVLDFVMSDATEDRDFDIIEPEGARYQWFLDKGPILWAHNSKAPSIGRPLSVELERGRLVTRIKFKDPANFMKGDPHAMLADHVFRSASRGFDSSGSIGFMVLPDGVREREDAPRGFRITDWEMLEFSILPVGSNRTAGRKWLEGYEGADEFEKLARQFADRARGERTKAHAPSVEGGEVESDNVDVTISDEVKSAIESHINETLDKAGAALNRQNRERLMRARFEIDQVLDDVDESEGVPNPDGESEHDDEMRSAEVSDKQSDITREDFPEVPASMKAELRRGLNWVEEGFGGEGLQQETVDWAERMADGEKPTPDKAVKMHAWWARHITTDGPLRDDDGDPTPKAVAWKLWGGKDAGVSYTKRLMRIMEREISDNLKDRSIEELAQKAWRERRQVLVSKAMLRKLAQDAGFALQFDTDTLEARIKASTRFQDLPLAARDADWDDVSAINSMRRRASTDGSGDKDTIDWSVYRQGFLLYDAEDVDLFGSYKMPYARVNEDGELVAVPRAIFAAAAVLQGARGGVDAFDPGDEERARRHIERYYAKMRDEFEDDNLIAPWNRREAGDTDDRQPSTSGRRDGVVYTLLE